MLRRARFLASVAAAGAGLARPSFAKAQASTVRVGVGTGSDAYAEGLYLFDKGFLRSAGLNAEMVVFRSGGEAISGLAAGATDVTSTTLVAVAEAISHGVPLSIVAGAGEYSSTKPTVGLCVASGSPIKGPQDFVGKTVAVTALRDLNELGTRAWLEQRNVDAGAVHFVELIMPAMPAALERGTVDAAVMGEPALSSAKSRIRIVGRPYDAIAPRFLITVWVAQKGWIEAHPDLALRFKKAAYASADWANVNPSDSAPILSKYSGLNQDLINGMARVVNATSASASLIDPVLATLDRYKVLTRKMSAGELS